MTKRQKIFVANRGEIALRVIDACDRLGIDTVLGVSTVDEITLPARRAGQTIILGGPRAIESYLNVPAVLHAAIATGCTGVHPGYGFLSERADFARQCAEHGLTFIGPRPDQLEALGDKLKARELATSVSVPVSPGGPTRTVNEAHALAADIGFPVLVKAAFGGGGRGMKLVRDAAELAGAWSLASAEAEASFGDGTVFVERFFEAAKHIEVQIIGDRQGHRIHLGERECSLQFRYQKILEEAPSLALSATARRHLHDYALRIADALDYLNLGTIEFLYDVPRNEICFLEVNPRVQVEHPVTEAITGVDLIRAQILVAFGETLDIEQAEIVADGHAIEVRLTAQDPAQGLRPSPGRVTRWRPPAIGGVRWDTHMYEGYPFPPYYDALMAKIIAHGSDRTAALDRLRASLDRLDLGDTTTNRDLLRELLDAPEIVHNTMTTRWLEDQFAKGKSA